jgi:hypothetical protein
MDGIHVGTYVPFSGPTADRVTSVTFEHSDDISPLREFIAVATATTHYGGMAFVVAALLGIALLIELPVLEELFIELVE